MAPRDTMSTEAGTPDGMAPSRDDTGGGPGVGARLRRAVLAAIAPEDSNLIRHATGELERAGELGPGGAYGGLIGDAVLDLVRVLAMHGHSGGSVELTLEVFNRLARFDVLTPITANPAEWREVPQPMLRPGEKRLWQNARKPSAFWREGDETWYDPDDRPSAQRATIRPSSTPGH